MVGVCREKASPFLGYLIAEIAAAGCAPGSDRLPDSVGA